MARFQEEDNDFFLEIYWIWNVYGALKWKNKEIICVYMYIYSVYIDVLMHMHTVLEFLRGYRVRDKVRMVISYSLAAYGNAQSKFICLEGEWKKSGEYQHIKVKQRKSRKKDGLFREFGDKYLLFVHLFIQQMYTKLCPSLGWPQFRVWDENVHSAI